MDPEGGTRVPQRGQDSNPAYRDRTPDAGHADPARGDPPEAAKVLSYPGVVNRVAPRGDSVASFPSPGARCLRRPR